MQWQGGQGARPPDLPQLPTIQARVPGCAVEGDIVNSLSAERYAVGPRAFACLFCSSSCVSAVFFEVHFFEKRSNMISSCFVAGKHFLQIFF